MEYQIGIGEHKIQVEKDENGLMVNGDEWSHDVVLRGDTYYIYTDQRVQKVRVLKKEGNTVTLLVNGKEVTATVQDHIALMLEKLGMDAPGAEAVNEILAPMPGVILNVLVAPGQEVKKGEPLLILEAMKMENLIKAPADATVASIEATKGQSVEKNAPLVKFA